MSKSTISLENFANWHGAVNGVEMRAYLPLPGYVPTADIQINLGRIARIGRVARLERLNFGLYDEDQKVNASVSGINPDGSATATAAKSAAATRARAHIPQWISRSGTFQRGEARIRVNANHPDMNDKVLRDAEPWAKLLDKGMRDGLKHAGRKQLLEPAAIRAKEALKRKAWDGMLAAGAAAIDQNLSNFPLVLGIFTALDAIDPVGLILGKKYPRLDMENSLTVGYPFDRYLATAALAHTTKLVTSK